MPGNDTTFDLAGKKIWVAGHRGMVGSAVVRRLEKEDGAEVLTAGRDRVDLRRQDQVDAFMAAEKPDAIVMAAARVGGILANDTYPADFLYDNLVIETNITEAAFRNGVGKMLFLGSSCIYPKMAPQPMREDALLTGPLEPTNQWYAIAKIAGIMLCQAYRRQHGCDFISAMPTNLYGPGDNFDLEKSHVVPALIRKMHEAKQAGTQEVTLWGSGSPKREFMHVDDLADALIFLLKSYSGEEHVNVGVGEDVSIKDLAELIGEVVGYKGRFVYDTSKPDGTPRKLMDVERLTAMGWTSKISLKDGLEDAYRWFRENQQQARM